MANVQSGIENDLWGIADELRANSGLKASEYATPVLGLIFLRYADYKFTQAEAALAGMSSSRRTIGKLDYQARGALYLPQEARFSQLLQLPEGEAVATAVDNAMKAIEEQNSELAGVLPKNYNLVGNATLVTLLKRLASFSVDQKGDVFGKIYEYFLGEFARSEGQKGGEFYTPTALVQLIVEIIEPFHGRILDPACGSGGMFVQSARFVERHKGNPNDQLSLFGQEKTSDTVRLCKMNLAVHSLSGFGDIREANTYYQPLEATGMATSVGQFDFVMANPPFNVNNVDKDRIKSDPRFPLGMPRTDNANYLWIQVFYSALNATGRAGFVMANSASDARGSEQDIRKDLIERGAVDVMVSVGPNFFYTVTLPCTLWFLDRGKSATPRRNTVLFLDARHIFTQVDRAHREFTLEQIAFLSNIVRLYRGEAPSYDGLKPEAAERAAAWLAGQFPDSAYADVAGLCRVATIKEIEAQGWSLNPGRYVGVAERAADDFVFAERLEELNEELEVLNAEARELEDRIGQNVGKLLEAVG